MKHKHPHSRNEDFAKLFRIGFKNYRQDFIIDGSVYVTNVEVLKRIKIYTAWLDNLGVSSIMMLCKPSINSLCLLYAAILSNRTILVAQSFMSNHMIVGEFERLNFDILVMDKAYVEKRAITTVVRLVFDPYVNFFYTVNRSPKKYSMLPGLLFYTENNFHRKKICHFHYSVLANKLANAMEQFNFSSSDVFMLNEQDELFSWMCSVFLPLCLGARLVLTDLSKRHKVNYLISIIQKYGVSTVFCFTEIFERLQRRIIEQKNGLAVVSLQKIFLFGDFSKVRGVQEWFKFVYPKTKIYQLFSATEYLMPFYKALSKEFPDDNNFCLGETSSDSDYALVEFEKGIYELFITGSLTTGYLDLMESLQHLAFQNGKLYFKTGVLVKIKENSLLYYAHITRVIKKQEYLINLDEIEHKFNEFHFYGKCAVISDLKSNIYMFIEGSNNAEDMYNLKNYLNQVLPAYVLVNFFEFLQKLPRTALGRINYYVLQTDLLNFFKKYFVGGGVDRNVLLSDLNLSQLDYLSLSEYAMVRTGRFLDLSYNQAGFRLKDIPKHLFPIPKPIYSSPNKVKIGSYHFAKFIQPYLKNGTDEGGFIFRYPLVPQISFYKLKLAILNTINNHYMLSVRVVNQSGSFYWARVKPSEDIIVRSNWFVKKEPLSDAELKININSPQLVRIYLEQIKKQKYLVISYHQIAMDDWSLNQLLFEVFARYQDKFINDLPDLSMQAFYLNRIGLPLTNTQKDIENLVKIFQRFPHVNSQSLTPVFSNRAPHLSSIIVIPKSNIDKFKKHHQISNEPDSSVFLILMYLSLSKALSVDSLIIHLTLFNRINPCYFSGQLLFNCQTFLPLLILPHSKIKKQASYITMMLSYYFHHMDFETIKHFYHNEQVKVWMNEQVSNDYKLLFSYVPSTKVKSQYQSLLIEWCQVQSQLTDEEQGRIFFRVCEMDQQFIVHLDTKLVGEIHSDILMNLKENFN